LTNKRTGFLYEERFFWHDTGSAALYVPAGGYVEPDRHGESPESKRRVVNLLARCGLLKQLELLEARAATVDEVEAVHDRAYRERVQELSDTTGGDAGDEAVVGRGSYEIALLAAGGAMAAVDAVLQGQVRNAYALTRPPGHHATPAMGMGFCLFNNAAIAVQYARRTYGLERILILDWDVHHGNGTEDMFDADPGVLFVSLHEEENYPLQRGWSEHIGVGAGLGYTVNVPLPAGTSEAGYMEALRRVVEPIVDQFRPELVLISAGQDANFFDPLGHMLVTADGYYQMTALAKAWAERHCDGRLVALHEGGYSTAYVPFCTLRIIEALSGLTAGVDDPFLVGINPATIAKVLPHQIAMMEETKQALAKHWTFNPANPEV